MGVRRTGDSVGSKIEFYKDMSRTCLENGKCLIFYTMLVNFTLFFDKKMI